MLNLKKILFGLITSCIAFVGIGMVFADTGLSKSVISQSVAGSQFANDGDTVTYTLSYYNSGSLPLAVNFTDNLPQGLTVSQAFSPIGSCATQLSLLNGTISINASNVLFAQNCVVNAMATGTITIVGSFVNPNYTNNTIANTVSAQVFTTQGVSVSTPNDATAVLYGYPVISAFSKQFTGALPQQLNDDVYYVVTFTNTGSIAAQGIVFTDTPPLGLTYVNSTPSLPAPTTNPLNTNLSWTLSIPAHTTQTYVLHFTVNNTALISAGLITNTGSIATGATALSGTLLTTPLQVSTSSQVAGFPYITLTKSILSPTSGYVYQSGDIVSYQITLTNTGTWAATGTVTDVLPSHLSGRVSSVAPSTMNGSTWTWTGITINPNQTVTITLTGVLNANYQANTVYTNTANFSLQSPVVGTVVNHGVVTGLILGMPNLIMTKTLIGPSSSATLSGSLVSYILTATQSGTALYTGSVCIQDIFPTSVTYLTSSVAPSGCIGALSWSGVLSPSFSVVVTGILNTNLSVGQIVTNTGIVSALPAAAIVGELTLVDNTDTASFAAGGSADMVLDKSILNSSLNGGIGSIATYQLAYSNTGQISGSTVIVSDFLPYPLLYSGQVSGPITPTSTPTSTGTLLTWNIGTVGANQSGAIVFQASFSGFVSSGVIVNTGKISTSTPDIDLTNNIDAVTSTLTAMSDIQITKTILTPAQGISGSLVSFLMTFVNNGAAATNFNIVDLMSGGLFQMVSFDSNLEDSQSNPLNFSYFPVGSNNLLGSTAYLLPGQTGYLIFTGQLLYQPLTGLSYTNTAYITGMINDGNPSNNTATVTGNISVSIGCSLTKTPQTSPWVFAPGGVDLSGQVVGYTLTLTNNGTIPLSGVSIVDTRPSSELSAPSSTNIIVASLPVGQSTGIVLTGKLLDRDVSSLVNSATASFVINGTQFSCAGSGDITRPAPACNNGYLEGAEQCDTYNGITYVFQAGSLVSFSTNSFSFDSWVTTQICNANCKLQTVSVNNCAGMTVPTATPSTITGCVALSGMINPLLTLTKTVTPSSNLSSGSIVRYTITVSNTSSGDAYNVQLGDVFPRSQLEYIGNMTTSAGVVSVLVNAGNQTFSGNLGAMPIGSTRTIAFDAKIKSSASTTITNTAIVNYTNAASVAMPQLTAPVTITVGSNPTGTCGDGVKSSVELCDLGTTGGVIVNYLDMGTSFPADSSSRGAICTSSCQIDYGVNRCGDGKLGRLEMCDMQVATGGSSVSIGNYLNNSGTLIGAGIYANTGYSCTSSCELVKPGVAAQMPACWASDSIISLMQDEVLPIVWDIELNKAGMVATQNDCTSSNRGAIVKDSLMCTIKLYNKDEEGDNGSTLTANVRCDNQDFTFNSQQFPVMTQNVTPYGTFLVNMTEDLIAGGYGEYKMSLDRVDYNYCNGNKIAISGNPYAKVCQVDIAITRPYLMQKSNTVFKPSDPLDDFFVLGYPNKTLISATQFDKTNEQTKLNSLEYKGKIQTLTQDLLKKYDKIAIKVPDTNLFPGATVKKVPGKSIYILDGSSDDEIVFAPSDNLDTPTTLIIKKGNLAIEGSVSSNMMILVPNGSVRFDLDEADQSCTEPQIIRGIVIASSFEGSKKDIWNTRDKILNKKEPWCARGNLHIYGALYGDNMQDLIDSRRSELERWFTYKDNFSLAPKESALNIHRKDLIYKGASVYIEQNPDLWRAMPPGADTFLKTLNVSRN